MAINKKLIHFKKFSDFNSKKLSANEANTQYTVGISGDVQNGNPDILYESIVWIKDTKQQWTHGQLYDCATSKETYLADFTMFSLRQGMNNGEQVRCDMNSLIEAMAANKTILVREDEESNGYSGVYVLNGYAEDLLYFSIVDYVGDVLYCNGTDYTNTSSFINGQTLHVRRWDDKADSGALSTVATSGSYNDLSDKPTIPSAVTESTVSGWGFTKNTGTYSKPSGGIPKSDLDSDVQGILNNAVTKKNFSDLEYIETQAIASEDFVYALPDTANGDEDDILLTAKKVKTINGESIYGSGDIEISGGGSSGGGKEVVMVDDVWTIAPNKIYVLDNSYRGGSEDISIGIIETSNALIDEYVICFKTFEEGGFIIAPTFLLPSYVKWANGIPPTIDLDTLYELSIVKTRLGDTDYFKAVLTSFK